MKKYKFTSIFILMLMISVSCEQEVIVADPPMVALPEAETPDRGYADFSKFVAIGNSLTAGYQAGALFTEGQQNSLGAILAKQFSTVGGGAFNQPDIGSANGFNTTAANPPVIGGPVLGRLVLFDPDGPGPRTAAPAALGTPAHTVTCPSTIETPAVPGAGGDLPAPYTGDKAALNNFSVPGILLAQALTPLTGGPVGNPAYNPLWARFASQPGVKTILEDAIAANGSFFLFFLGNNDVLGYASTGGSGEIPLTPTVGPVGVGFEASYQTAISLLLANPAAKGVIGTIPDVTTIPFFFTVKYNDITLTGDQATVLNTTFTGYNTVLDGIKENPELLALSGSTAANLDARKVYYHSGAGNKVLIAEKTPNFPDLGPTFDAMVKAGVITPEQKIELEPYRQVRQATANDLITLSTGSILGTCLNPPGDNAQLIIGVSIPLEDRYVLLPSEITQIKARTAVFNGIIKAAASSSDGRLALADVNKAFADFVAAQAVVEDGVTLTPSFAPPTGGFSEDGIHPNSRGYAYLANIFIDAINSTFSAKIPKASLADYPGVDLPLNP